jgi:hypothetical protein
MGKSNKTTRELVFNKYGGKCAYCGTDLIKGWHVDHFEPMRSNMDGTFMHPERDTLENYNPSCASCNILKSSHSLEYFRQIISGFINSLNLRSTQYKFAKRYGLVSEIEKPVQFYFETINSHSPDPVTEFDTLQEGDWFTGTEEQYRKVLEMYYDPKEIFRTFLDAVNKHGLLFIDDCLIIATKQFKKTQLTPEEFIRRAENTFKKK